MWNDWRIVEVDYEKIRNIHWDQLSKGVNAPAPQYFIHAYVWCDDYEGELAHSCQHGKASHFIFYFPPNRFLVILLKIPVVLLAIVFAASPVLFRIDAPLTPA